MSSGVAPLRVADLEIDALHRRIRQGRREIRLSPGQHTLLYTLAASGLRRKLRDDPDRPRYIETVSRVGYRFIGAPEKSGG